MADEKKETTETKVDEPSKSTSSQEETKEETTKVETEVKEEKVTTETIEEKKETILDGIESTDGDERGKFKYEVGDSVYYGNTEKEVVNKALQGIKEKDSVIRGYKASEKVKIPDEYTKQKQTVEEPIVELPDDTEVYLKHLQTEVKKAGLDAKMLSWKDEDWAKHEDENALRPWKIAELRQSVRNIVDKANQATDRDMAIATIAVDNNRILEQATSQVREMLKEAEINIDDFDFKAAIDKAMEKKDKNGRILNGAIEKESAIQIMRIQKKSTPVKRDLQKEIAKSKEAKEKIKAPATGAKITDEDGKILPFEDLGRQIKSQLPSRAGRDI